MLPMPTPDTGLHPLINKQSQPGVTAFTATVSTVASRWMKKPSSFVMVASQYAK